MNEVRNIIVGFDFGEKVSQICYLDRQEGEPVSLPIKVGTGQLTFPNCLSKMPEKEEWHFGLEVPYFVKQKNEILVEHLYELAMGQTHLAIDGENRSVGEILGIFIKQALKVLGVPDLVKSISGIMITVPTLTKVMVENFRLACKMIGFQQKRCFLQSYGESFFYYALNQKPEICGRNMALFAFNKDEVTCSKLAANRKTIPAQIKVQQGKTITLSQDWIKRDLEFYNLILESLGTEIYSGIFIVGDGFDREWAVKSIPILCRNHRHVFYGNNLYAKGACYGAREKVEERKLKGYLYIGNDLIRTNIGMEMMIDGAKGYYSLISAGVNWYEAIGECEILLDDVDCLEFLVSDMEASKKERYSMKLENLPKRPVKATRLHLHLEFESVNACRIEVRDVGFGELYPSSGMVWQETMEV